jgi:hypothetical protein
MKESFYKYIKNKTMVEGWEHLTKDAKMVGTCLEVPKCMVDKDGYPKIKINGKQWRAARFSYTVNWGPILKGMFICHYCDNTSCIAPRHLWAGTPKQNAEDRDLKGRHRTAPSELTKHIGIKNGSSKLSEKEVLAIRKDYIPNTNKSMKHSNGNCTQLAKKYGVSRTLIKSVVMRKIWKHI